MGKVIYETKGRAREYRELACNLYTGCDHGCSYCYVPGVLRRKRDEFHKNIEPRKGIIKSIDRESKILAAAGEKRQVLLCFTCDPYMITDEKYEITRQAIQTLHKNGLNVCVLTKGGSRALRDIDLFGLGDSFGTTLTCAYPYDSMLLEPGAESPADRMQTIKNFHFSGINTWVSLEPVIYPDQTLEIIRLTHKYVDEYKVGALNYCSVAPPVNWADFVHELKALFEQLDCQYQFKKDLRKWL